MRIDINLKAISAEASRQFYVDELRLFTANGVSFHGMSCLLFPIGYRQFRIYLDAYFSSPPQTVLFTLQVNDCDSEFARLRQVVFTSGGRIVPDENGGLNVTRDAEGRHFTLEDPTGNRFRLFDNNINGNAEGSQ